MIDDSYKQIKWRVRKIVNSNRNNPAEKLFDAIQGSFHDVPISTITKILDELIDESVQSCAT
jgi:hypothetical protein